MILYWFTIIDVYAPISAISRYTCCILLFCHVIFVQHEEAFMYEPLSIFKMINLSLGWLRGPETPVGANHRFVYDKYILRRNRFILRLVITECGVYSQLCSLSAGARPSHTNLFHIINKILNQCHAWPRFATKNGTYWDYITWCKALSPGLLCSLMIKVVFVFEILVCIFIIFLLEETNSQDVWHKLEVVLDSRCPENGQPIQVSIRFFHLYIRLPVTFTSFGGRRGTKRI